ncbi:MAG: YceD family protein [Limisphaerales bacterium]
MSWTGAVFFHVRNLEVRAGRFDVELPPGAIEFLDPKLRQAGLLRAAGKVEMVSDSLGEIRVKGHAAVLMEAECDRCLDPVRIPVDSDFELYYRPVSEGYGEDAAVDKSESEMGFYEGEGLELNDVLREYVLLSLPMQRLCRENCKGICPECGQNRNNKECQCQASAADDRWAALKQFKSKTV